MTGNDKDTIYGREWWVIIALSIIAAIAIWLAQCGCSGQTVKPNNDLTTSVKATQKSQQKMTEKIDTLQGDLTKVQQSISTFISNVTNILDQKFETFQGSTRTSFEKFSGEMKTINKSSANTTAYGIGLVATVLIFVLAVIWIGARMLKGAVGKVLR